MCLLKLRLRELRQRMVLADTLNRQKVVDAQTIDHPYSIARKACKVMHRAVGAYR
jgi:hypothetical protein